MSWCYLHLSSWTLVVGCYCLSYNNNCFTYSTCAPVCCRCIELRFCVMAPPVHSFPIVSLRSMQDVVGSYLINKRSPSQSKAEMPHCSFLVWLNIDTVCCQQWISFGECVMCGCIGQYYWGGLMCLQTKQKRSVKWLSYCVKSTIDVCMGNFCPHVESLSPEDMQMHWPSLSQQM